MAKILSAREASLQRKLIPLNIVVLVLALVSVISLIFAPLLKVDVGKILRNEATIEFLEEKLDEEMGNLMGGSDGSDGGFSLDVTPIVTTAVVEVLSKAEGDLSFSTFELARYARDDRSNKIEIIADGLFYGEKGIVSKLVNSLIAGITDVFTTAEGKGVLENAVVDGLLSSMSSIVSSVAGSSGSEIAKEIQEKLTEEKVGELKDVFFEINNAQSKEDVVEVVDSFVEKLNETLGADYNISAEDKEAVTDYIVELYEETIAELEASGEDIDFSLEAMICIAVSENVDLDEFNINAMLQQFLGGMGGSSSVEDRSTIRASLTEGEGEPVDHPSTKRPPLTYGDLFSEAGLGEQDREEISEMINSLVKNFVGDYIDNLDSSLNSGFLASFYPHIFLILLGVLGIFILPWLILALAAFIRIFTKNKRFTMWYAKLLGFFPALIFAVLFVVKTWLLDMITSSLPAETAPLVPALLGGVSSLTWICGLCYVLLWLVSIFWAFPIKHKIRKERKACKNGKGSGMGGYESYEREFGYAVKKSNVSESYSYDGGSAFDDDDEDEDYSYNDD